MKSLAKIGVLAMALGMFAACHSANNNGTANDSTNTEMSAPATQQPVAPADTATNPADTAAADTGK
jgi:hypothetical protein